MLLRERRGHRPRRGGAGLAVPVPAPEQRGAAGGLGTPAQDITLASGTSHPAQHKQLGPGVPSCSLRCPSTRFCIQQSPARHGTATAQTIIGHGAGEQRASAGGQWARAGCGTVPLYPTVLAAQPNTPLPPRPLPSPSPREAPGPSAPQGTPWMGAPGRLRLPWAVPPPTGRGHEAIPWGHWHGSWERSPTAQAGPTHLPGLATTHQAELKLPFSSPPVCNMQLGKTGAQWERASNSHLLHPPSTSSSSPSQQ